MLDRLDWKAAVWAGFIAGVVFMMVEMLLVATVGGESPWAPPRMIAAMVMGKEVLPPPATFDAAIIAIGMAVHMALAIVLGLVFGLLLSRLSRGLFVAILVGTAFGLAVYLVDFYLFTELFPWFAMARGTISIFAHAVFGLVLGGAYHAFARRSADADRVRDGRVGAEAE